MRIYTDFSQVMNEVARDLLEMGIMRQTLTMQDKDISNNPGYDTKELIAYSFCVTNILSNTDVLFSINPDGENLRKWCDREFHERINDKPINPGIAWTIRHDMWEPFLRRNKGKFSYTYNERIRTQLDRIIETLDHDPGSRQCILSIWNPTIDIHKLGVDRVPCSIFYHFLMNGDKLDMIYYMRSCDFINHMCDDIYLAVMMQRYVINLLNCDYGRFYMNVSSLHYYKKDEDILNEFMKIGDLDA